MARKAKTTYSHLGAMADRDYQAEDDSRTLIAAHKIKQDPGRHSRAKEHMKMQMGHLAAVAMDKGTRSGIEPPQDKPVGPIKGAPKKVPGQTIPRSDDDMDEATHSGSPG